MLTGGNYGLPSRASTSRRSGEAPCGRNGASWFSCKSRSGFLCSRRYSSGWRSSVSGASRMRREWAQLTGESPEPNTPRHSEHEIRLLFAAVDHPDLDPRMRLAFILGAEARLGQVRERLMRSDVDLSNVGAFGLGRIVVRGKGKKKGVVRDLTPEERAAVDRALTGYLRLLEDAYQSGVRDDYPMLPAGRLVLDFAPSRAPRRYAGPPPVRRARATVSDTPIGKSALHDLFHAFERLAGVTPLPGRGWYGIRRKAADVYEDHERDERVLNDQTGHSSSETRRSVYQERKREDVLAKSAATRRRVRQAAFGVPLVEKASAPASGLNQGVDDGVSDLPSPLVAQHTPHHTPQGEKSGYVRRRVQRLTARRAMRWNKSGRRDLNPRPPEPHSVLGDDIDKLGWRRSEGKPGVGSDSQCRSVGGCRQKRAPKRPPARQLVVSLRERPVVEPTAP